MYSLSGIASTSASVSSAPALDFQADESLGSVFTAGRLFWFVDVGVEGRTGLSSRETVLSGASASAGLPAAGALATLAAALGAAVLEAGVLLTFTLLAALYTCST